MKPRTFQLSDTDARAMMAAYEATNDGPYRTRLQAVRLYGLGYTTTDITTITGCARSSLMDWCRAYGAGGVTALTDHRTGGNHAKLSHEQIADLSTKLRLYTPCSLFGSQTASADGQTWTVVDLVQAVTFWYGVTYKSTVSYYSLFDRCDFRYLQPAKAFRSRSERAVAAFEVQLEKN
jgi:transposase